jgi:hypothetical protein
MKNPMLASTRQRNVWLIEVQTGQSRRLTTSIDKRDREKDDGRGTART